MEDFDSTHSGPQRLDLFPLPADVRRGQFPRGPRTLGVVGNREILVAELLARTHHVSDGVASVAPRAVRVEIPADVLLRQEVWQLAALGGRNLVAPIAQFWSNERQSQRGIDVGFERELRPSGAHTRHRCIRKSQSETLGACPQLIDVGSRSCVPDERGAGLFGRGQMEGDVATRGLRGDTGGSAWL